MSATATIRTAQAAGRRRGGVLARLHGTDFRRGFGADGSVSALVSFHGLRIGDKSVVILQLTVQAAWVRSGAR